MPHLPVQCAHLPCGPEHRFGALGHLPHESSLYFVQEPAQLVDAGVQLLKPARVLQQAGPAPKQDTGVDYVVA